jgi:hypothetical protein
MRRRRGVRTPRDPDTPRPAEQSGPTISALLLAVTQKRGNTDPGCQEPAGLTRLGPRRRSVAALLSDDSELMAAGTDGDRPQRLIEGDLLLCSPGHHSHPGHVTRLRGQRHARHLAVNAGCASVATSKDAPRECQASCFAPSRSVRSVGCNRASGLPQGDSCAESHNAAARRRHSRIELTTEQRRTRRGTRATPFVLPPGPPLLSARLLAGSGG